MKTISLRSGFLCGARNWNSAQSAKLSRQFSTAIRQNSSIHDTLLCISCMLSKINISKQSRHGTKIFWWKYIWKEKIVKKRALSWHIIWRLLKSKLAFFLKANSGNCAFSAVFGHLSLFSHVHATNRNMKTTWSFIYIYLNNNTHTSLASHSCENSFVLKHECEAKDVWVLLFKFRRHLCKGSM